MFKCAWTVQDYDGHTSYWYDFWFKGYSCLLLCQWLYWLSNECHFGANRCQIIRVCNVKIWMKCVHTFGTGRHKRQADITLLFQYMRQTIKLSSSHALLYSFLVFKHVTLILRKEQYILGRIGLYFWGFGEKLNYFRDLGSKGKILLGSQRNYFQGFWEINALFSGIKGAQNLLGASFRFTLQV